MELPEDSLTPSRVIGLLEVEENIQDKLTVSESCRDIMFQTEKRVSRGTKLLRTELKERVGAEDPNEAVRDDLLKNLADAAKQRDGPEVALVSMSLPRLWDGDDHSLTPLARESAGEPNAAEQVQRKGHPGGV